MRDMFAAARAEPDGAEWVAVMRDGREGSVPIRTS